jgi:NADH-quinone oxidoreductase subunit C
MSEQKGMFGASGTGDTSGYGGLVRAANSPTSAQRPYGSYFDDVADELERAFPEFNDAIEKVVVDRGELTLHIKRERLFDVAKTLRDTELHAVYELLSMTYNRRIRLEVSVPDSDPHIPSLVEVWAGTNWHEREAYDMFGIIFDGHPALTRILMPDDWPGHPQRKDYPLGGIPVEYIGATVPAPDNRRSYR